MTSIKLVPQDFELVSGNDKTLRFTLTDENGDPVNLTGATIIWAFAKTATSKASLFDYTSPANVTITDPPTDGLFEVDIQRADTEGFKGGEYYHECRVQSAAGNKITVAYGVVTLLDNVIDS